ncbi:Protein CLEC16A, partial [Galemys pyrenaicus]
NSDLIACTVITKDGGMVQRFLAVDIYQMSLVEPDVSRLGWGVVKFAGLLQDMLVTGVEDDSRALNITIHKPASSPHSKPFPILQATFVFSDHIRCIIAKQRLVKGRIQARRMKMQRIAGEWLLCGAASRARAAAAYTPPPSHVPDRATASLAAATRPSPSPERVPRCRLNAALLDLPIQPTPEVLGFGFGSSSSTQHLPFRFYDQCRRGNSDPTVQRSVFASVDKVPGKRPPPVRPATPPGAGCRACH